jgi:uncharacterized protein (TIGR02391 family)
MALRDNFPEGQQLLEMGPEELGPFVLRYLSKLPGGDVQSNRHNFTNQVAREYESGRHTESFVEAWMWLEREGFLAPRPGQQGGDWVFVTRKGRQIIEEENFEAYKKASIFPTHIDSVLVRSVKPLFMRGDYDTAVFRAFKEVEVRVRKKANYGNEEYGRDLMVHAFGPSGPLLRKAATKGEQDAMRELFAGAIAQCKNPSSHREVQFDDAGEVIDMICFANLLLRIVERI